MLPDWLREPMMPYRSVQRNGYSFDHYVETYLPPEHLAGLRHLCLLILRPDSLMNGEATRILDSLQDTHGMVPLRLRVLHMRPYLIDSLYRFKLAAFGDSVWLHHDVFGIGPAAAVILTGNPLSFASLSERLDHLKGASSPGQETSQPTLRSQFNRASSFHAVVHTAQDPAAFLYEATLVFPWAAIREVLGLVAHMEGVDPGPLALPPAYRRALLALAGPPYPSVFQTLFLTKRRILASCLLRTPREQHHGLNELWKLMDEAAVLTSGPPYQAQLEAFAAFVKMEREPLRALISSFEDVLPRRMASILHSGVGQLYEESWREVGTTLSELYLLYATWYLSGHDVYTLDDGHTIFAALEDSDVPLSPWERTVIQSGLRADVNRDARWDGRAIFSPD